MKVDWAVPFYVQVMLLHCALFVCGCLQLFHAAFEMMPVRKQAVKAAESASAGESKSTRTALAFFWQTPGALVPYVVAWVLLQFSRHGGPHYETLAQLEFRLVFGS